MPHEIEIKDITFKNDEILVESELPNGDIRKLRIKNNDQTRKLQEVNGVEAPRYIQLARADAKRLLESEKGQEPDDHDPKKYKGEKFSTDVPEAGSGTQPKQQ